jgi:hypothetical protein
MATTIFNRTKKLEANAKEIKRFPRRAKYKVHHDSSRGSQVSKLASLRPIFLPLFFCLSGGFWCYLGRGMISVFGGFGLAVSCCGCLTLRHFLLEATGQPGYFLNKLDFIDRVSNKPKMKRPGDAIRMYRLC